MKIPWRGAIGLALTATLLWVAFRDVRWVEVWQVLRKANVGLAILSIVVATSIFPLRAIRWRPILGPIAPDLPFGPLWRATAIGMMANNVLFARAGELVRAFMLSRETSVPFSASFASLVVDRVFDGVVIIGLMLLAMFNSSFPSSTEVAGQSVSNWAGGGVVTLVVITAALYAIVFLPDRLIGLYEMLVRRVAPRFEERGRVMLRSFADGLSVLRHPARFLSVFAWTAAHWLTNALAFWIMFQAFDIAASFWAALFLQGLIVFLVALPSTPGFFGPWEFGAVAGLTLYGVDQTVGAAWAIAFHVLSLIPITIIGIYYLLRSGMKLGELKQIRS